MKDTLIIIYLKEETESSSICWFIPYVANLKPGARCFLPCVQPGCRGLSTWTSSITFPSVLAGNWIRVGTWTCAHLNASDIGNSFTCFALVPTPKALILKNYLKSRKTNIFQLLVLQKHTKLWLDQTRARSSELNSSDPLDGWRPNVWAAICCLPLCLSAGSWIKSSVLEPGHSCVGCSIPGGI